jgi:hypothetical protein
MRETLSTIQKRNKPNDVYALGEKGHGSAYHKYAVAAVVPKDASFNIKRIAEITFQCGPRSDPDSTHGVLDVDLLEIVRHRLQCFQAGPYACRENALALTHIEEALLWLNKRVEDRAERGVLGTSEK